MTEISLLITRPSASAAEFIAALAGDIRQSVEIVSSPLLEIVPTGITPDVAGYAGVIFTSANAVVLAPKAISKTVYCVGEATAAQAEAAGWLVSLVARNADGLVAQIKELNPPAPLLHFGGKHRRGEIAMRLTAVGIKVDEETLYDQAPLALTNQAYALLGGEGQIVVPLFSPRTAALFLRQVQDLHNVIIVAMSDAVAECCQNKGAAQILVAASPTGQEMCRTVEKVLRDATLA